MVTRNKKALLGILLTSCLLLPAPVKAFWGSLFSNTVDAVKENKYTLLVAGVASVAIGTLWAKNRKLEATAVQWGKEREQAEETFKEFDVKIQSLEKKNRQLREKALKQVEQKKAVVFSKGGNPLIAGIIFSLKNSPEIFKDKKDKIQAQGKELIKKEQAMEQYYGDSIEEINKGFVELAQEKKELKKKREELDHLFAEKQKELYNSWYSEVRKKEKELIERQREIKEVEEEINQAKRALEEEKKSFEQQQKGLLSVFFG